MNYNTKTALYFETNRFLHVNNVLAKKSRVLAVTGMWRKGKEGISDPTLELMNIITVPVGNDTAASYVPEPMGEWPSERPAWTAVHEAGHLLGFLDMYDPDTKKAYDKWEGNIMTSRDGTVDDRNIDEVLRNRHDDNTIRSGFAGQQNEPTTTAINPAIKNH